MADVEGLYIVTGVVLLALVVWVLVVLVRAPNAVDLSTPPAAPPPAPVQAAPPVTPDDEPPPDPPSEAEPKIPAMEQKAPVVVATRDSSQESVEAPVELSVTPPPTVVSAEPDPEDWTPAEEKPAAPSSARSSRVHTMLGLTPPEPIATLDPARSRLDSHLEIQDSPPSPTVILMPEPGAGVTASGALVLVTAVGQGLPPSGRSPERHAILDRHHLLVFADGGGKKAGEELASGIVVDAVVDAFEQDEVPASTDDPKLPVRAQRIRRAALAANRRLLHRAREAGYAGMGTSMMAAYFSPDHRELFVAHVGSSRAYCIRDGELTRLTTPHGARTLGVIERVDVEVVEDAVRSGDLYLFCSDALGRALSESELVAWVNAEPSLKALTQKLVEVASAKDDAQTLVAIVVRVDPAPASPANGRPREQTVLGLG
jgi:serine/threonine protein phosphatase PrpC